MKLSVVVPVYNVENYLEQCINSIIEQTLSVYEIILVDDGSTDNSGNICDGFSKAYDFIKTIHKQNEGLGRARNTGLEKVKGDFVTFIDSDDFLEKDFLEKMSKIIEETGCDTCKTSFRRVDLEGKFVSNDRIIEGDFKGKEVQEKFIPRIIGSAPDKKDSIPMSVCCSVYSMSIIRDNNLQFVSEREWISEDIIFNLQYYSKSNHTVLSGYIGYNYRINTNSLTTKYLPDRFEKCIVLYEKEIEILMEKNLFGICKYRLDRQFFNYLRMCFKQLKNSTMNKKERKIEIKKICNDSKVQKIVREYPIRELGIVQKTFLYFVKHQLITPIYIYFCK